jgi:diguanylate cyclase (GGDEF)-like protein/PAS domain S-box-containing protein
MGNDDGGNGHGIERASVATRLRASPAAEWRPHHHDSGQQGADAGLDDLPIGVVVLRDQAVVAVNAHWTAMTGRTLAESAGSRWLAAVHEVDRNALVHVVAAARDGAEATSDTRLVEADGRAHLWVQVRIRRIVRDGGVLLVMALTEIGLRKRREDSLLELAAHDALTGVLNRAAFLGALDARLHDGDADAPLLVGVLFVDLDHFKAVNDRFGHHTGDRVLVAACRRIQSAIRSGDTIGRLGGDEIGVICPVLRSLDECVQVAERIVGAMEEPFTIGAEVVTLGASVGVALASDRATAPDDLVRDADTAMYVAKRDHRDGWAVFDAPAQTRTRDEVAASADVALATGTASVERLERHLLALWTEACGLRDAELTTRLSSIGHAVHRAAAALDGDVRIG